MKYFLILVERELSGTKEINIYHAHHESKELAERYLMHTLLHAGEASRIIFSRELPVANEGSYGYALLAHFER